MSYLKKLTAVCLLFIMCVSITSCGDTSWAMEIDGQKPPAGLYILYQYIALNDAKQHEDFNSELKDIWDNQIEDKKIADWINEQAAQTLKEHVEIDNLFSEANMELTQEQQETLDYSVKQNWPSNEATFRKFGVAESSYRLMLENSIKYQQLFNAHYGEGGPEEVPEADLMTEYEQNYASVHVITFSLKNSSNEDLSEEEKQAVQEKEQTYLQRLQDGEDIATLIKEYAKEQAVAQDQEEPADEDINTDPRIIQKGEVNIYNYLPETINTSIFETVNIDEPVILNDTSADYLVLKHDITQDTKTFEDLKPALLSSLKNDDFEVIIADKANELSVTNNDNALKQFKPSKLV